MSVALLKAIEIKGSRRKLAKEIDATPEMLNAWLNRGVNIPLEFAIEIERLTHGQVLWTEIAPHLAHFAKRWAGFSILNHCLPIRTGEVGLSRIKSRYGNPTLTQPPPHLVADIKLNGLKRPICVDTDNNLIFGKKRLQAHKILAKQTILSRQLSLPNLIAQKYSRDELARIFTCSERVAIGLAVEKFLGNRQRQNKKSIGQNFPQFKGRTDHFLSTLLDFGNHQTYKQAKKVMKLGSPLLTEAVDQKRLAISAAALLATLPLNEQSEALLQSKKEVAAIIRSLRAKKSFFIN